MELFTDSMAAIVSTSLEHLYLMGEEKLRQFDKDTMSWPDAIWGLLLASNQFCPLLDFLGTAITDHCYSNERTIKQLGNSQEGTNRPFISWTVFMSLYGSSPYQVTPQDLLLWGQDHLTQHGVHRKFGHPAANLNTQTWDRTSISSWNQFTEKFNYDNQLKNIFIHSLAT